MRNQTKKDLLSVSLLGLDQAESRRRNSIWGSCMNGRNPSNFDPWKVPPGCINRQLD